VTCAAVVAVYAGSLGRLTPPGEISKETMMCGLLRRAIGGVQTLHDVSHWTGGV
jgi:hypothetical protein